jgi:hypothetical protein
MNPRRVASPSTAAMAHSAEYRIDFSSSANEREPVETIGEEIASPLPPTPRANATTDVNNDHLQQLIHFLKENLTSTLPFALILLLKAFYEHSPGKI